MTIEDVPTMWVVDPDDPNPDGLVELTCQEFDELGGDFAALRDDAAATNDWDLVAMIDEYLAS